MERVLDMQNDMNTDKAIVYLGAVTMLFAMLFGIFIRFNQNGINTHKIKDFRVLPFIKTQYLNNINKYGVLFKSIPYYIFCVFKNAHDTKIFK